MSVVIPESLEDLEYAHIFCYFSFFLIVIYRFCKWLDTACCNFVGFHL